MARLSSGFIHYASVSFSGTLMRDMRERKHYGADAHSSAFPTLHAAGKVIIICFSMPARTIILPP